jgi:hypothetical protein
MNVRQAVFGFLLSAVSAAASACDLPKLVAIPSADDLGGDTPQLFVRVQAYVTGIRTYTACIQAELAAGGGDAAPVSLRAQLIARNNAAVAEARAVLASFSDRIAPSEDLYLAAFVDGAGEDCVQATRLQGTAVINDVAIVLVERDGSGHLNLLEDSCQNLERYGQFDVLAGTGGEFANLGGAGPSSSGIRRLCSNDFIEPYASVTTEVRGRQCALGRFFDLTSEQTAQLMEARAAARPSASQGEASEPAGEETQERRRRER